MTQHASRTREERRSERQATSGSTRLFSCAVPKSSRSDIPPSINAQTRRSAAARASHAPFVFRSVVRRSSISLASAAPAGTADGTGASSSSAASVSRRIFDDAASSRRNETGDPGGCERLDPGASAEPPLGIARRGTAFGERASSRGIASTISSRDFARGLLS